MYGCMDERIDGYGKNGGGFTAVYIYVDIIWSRKRLFEGAGFRSRVKTDARVQGSKGAAKRKEC